MSDSLVIETSVIIVGAGIAGLTLAIAFERSQIPYVLLEAHTDVAPEVGASIGLLPNGLLVLDQLGVYSQIQKVTTPCRRSYHRDGQGNVLLDSMAFDEFEDKLGYHMVLLERRKLLGILYDGLRDKSTVKTNSKVVHVEEKPGSVIVRTSTGLAYGCKLVIGADGVHSRVRQNIAKQYKDQGISTNLGDYLCAQFSCVFGISSPLEFLPPGDGHFHFQKGHNFCLFTGKDGVIYWFLFEDMGTTFNQGEIPRFNLKDAEESCTKYLDSAITPSIKFGDIYSNTIFKTKTAFEEGVASHWHTNRIVLLGDSAHKMTTNSAMGGNMAIESAACLANCLVKAVRRADVSKETDFDDLPAALAEYQRLRFVRTSKAKASAGELTRAQFLPTLFVRFAINNVLPRTTPAQRLKTLLAPFHGAIKMDYLPIPTKARKPPADQRVVEAMLKSDERFRAFTRLGVFILGMSFLVPLTIYFHG